MAIQIKKELLEKHKPRLSNSLSLVNLKTINRHHTLHSNNLGILPESFQGHP